MIRNILFIFIVISFNLYATSDLPSDTALQADQVLPGFQEEKKHDKFIPEDNVLPHLNIKDQDLKKIVIEARSKLQNIMRSPTVPSQANDINIELTKHPPKVVEQIVTTTASSVEKPKSRKKRKINKKTFILKDGTKIFYNNLKFKKRITGLQTVTLPSTSSALITLMGGIEPPVSTKVHARIDYAFLGPNGTIVGLKNCMVWLKFKHSYTTGRGYGEGYKLSCRAPNGKTFSISIKAQTQDGKDEYVGAKGKLNMNGKIMAGLLSFLKVGTEEFGKAVEMSNISKTVSAGNANQDPVQGQSFTGNDQNEFILKKSSAAAVGGFLNFFVDFYKSMAPTLSIHPGKKLYLVIEDDIQIPKVFFTKKFSVDDVKSVLQKYNTKTNTNYPSKQIKGEHK